MVLFAAILRNACIRYQCNHHDYASSLRCIAEHVGHLVVTSNIVAKDLMKEPGLQRSLLGDWPR